MNLRVTSNRETFKIETIVQEWETHELVLFMFDPTRAVQKAGNFPFVHDAHRPTMRSEVQRVYDEVIAEINARAPKPRLRMGSYSYAHHDDYEFGDRDA